MSIPRLVCFLLLVAAIACQLSPKPSQESSSSDSKPETITVTIDGRDATPEEKEAFGDLGKKVLSDAVHKAINKGIEELLTKLEITDPVELQLFSVPFEDETSAGAELWSVYLLRLGSETKQPRTIALLRDGKPIARFTRATGRVERPIAVMSLTGTKNGRLRQADMFLFYGSDGKWKQYRPIERKENLRTDHE